MFSPIIARRIPAAPDFGPLHGDITFAELWALLDMAAYVVYDLVLLHYLVETLVGESQPGDAKVEESGEYQAAVVKRDKTNKQTKQQQNEHRDKRPGGTNASGEVTEPRKRTVAVENEDDKEDANAREAKRESDDSDNDRNTDNDNYKDTDTKDTDSGDKASDAEDKTDGQNELKRRRSPAFNDYHLEEWPPPRRDWSRRLQRKDTAQRATQRNTYDNGTSTKQQRQRQEVSRDDPEPVSSAGVCYTGLSRS
ncbi:uncharacterized protein LOC119391815 [Rhipicephalus sanguineus]|uniref:uncharacterized protein LOC119391815 n=1 Tax=Rhipicephalus sanguineus TaxID=34632 RepID=UPI0018962F79|nr:uncharacterized protein LOC119391815 [Rhipicephalus sanguineus]